MRWAAWGSVVHCSSRWGVPGWGVPPVPGLVGSWRWVSVSVGVPSGGGVPVGAGMGAARPRSRLVMGRWGWTVLVPVGRGVRVRCRRVGCGSARTVPCRQGRAERRGAPRGPRSRRPGPGPGPGPLLRPGLCPLWQRCPRVGWGGGSVRAGGWSPGSGTTWHQLIVEDPPTPSAPGGGPGPPRAVHGSSRWTGTSRWGACGGLGCGWVVRWSAPAPALTGCRRMRGGHADRGRSLRATRARVPVAGDGGPAHWLGTELFTR